MDQVLPISLDSFCHGVVLLAAAAFEEALDNPENSTQVDPATWSAAVHAAYSNDGAVLRDIWHIPVPEAVRIELLRADGEYLMALLLSPGPDGTEQAIGGISVNHSELGLWPPRLAAWQLLASQERWRQSRHGQRGEHTDSFVEVGWATHLTLLERVLAHAARR